ncbi:unnamed protein product [Adineta ricciae]|uniref:Uncharacterized protein n=1 Tax=Adineta ricciae TaxID=249248 RepID=A0A814W703_ADIRI|nr:unnamed protein product [Adineta ricciae]CAF1536576.1 unnamed protein product [Adineta ricciae]
MFHSKLLIILVLITNGLSKPFESSPQRCCFPKRYSTKIRVFAEEILRDGSVIKTFNEYEEAHDLDNGLVATRGPTNHSVFYTPRPFHDIVDYKNKVRYSLSPDGNHCVKQDSDYPLENCIEERESYVNSAVYNHNGNEILVDTWAYYAYGLLSYQTVSRDNCIKVESRFFHEDGRSSTKVTSDYSQDIVDPSIFTIPKACQS